MQPSCQHCGMSLKEEKYELTQWEAIVALMDKFSKQSVCMFCLHELGERILKFTEEAERREEVAP